MNTKLRVLLFTLVLLACMIAEGESFHGASGNVGKRSTKQLSEERNALPLGTRNFRLAQEDSDVVRVRRDHLCELAKRTC